MARTTLMPGYKYSGGSYVCVNCAHDDSNHELLKTFGTERDPIFYGECSEIKAPKCAICKTKLVDVVSNAYSRSSNTDDGDGEAPAKKASPKKAASPTKKTPAKKTSKKTDAPKKRGHPAKAKTELYYNDDPLSEPGSGVGVVPKRGRGRPKGSKNKPKVA